MAIGTNQITNPLDEEATAHHAATPKPPIDKRRERVWARVSISPKESLWSMEGLTTKELVKRVVRAFFADNLLGRAAELGFYFLFALFPAMVSASAILGLAARSASSIYDHLLGYLAVVMPQSAMGLVLATFRETTAASTSGKITFGIAAAVWSASVGFSAIQDTLNTVYKVEETRPYWRARLSAIGVTMLLSILITLILASMLGGSFAAGLARADIGDHGLAAMAAGASRAAGWLLAAALLSLTFSAIYYFAPDVRRSRWHFCSPGAVIAIAVWLAGSMGLRIYLHYFNNFSVTYGSLGAVIILLMWFYLTGLVLLLGAEINSEIEAAAAERHLGGLDRANPATYAPTLLQA